MRLLNLSKKKTAYAAGFLFLIFFMVFPLIVDSETSYLVFFFFTTFIYITLAQGWNLVAGYTGQVSLGQHAFFGLGAYITAITWRAGLTGYLDPLAMLMSGAGAAILAFAVGMLLLSNLRDDYFALGSLGVGEILRVAALNGGSLTDGPAGLSLPSDSYISMNYYYYIALLIMIISLIIILVVTRSRIGLALVAIRENETAAAANGIAVLKFKTMAFTIGAFITGLCGSLNAYYQFHVHPPGAFSLNWVIIPVLMVLLGGSGTFLGPILGAFILSAAFELINIWVPELHPIFTGAFIVVITLFIPYGLMSFLTGHKQNILQKLSILKWRFQKT
jgi:branched-chain amino acid transport system permease protein